MLQQSMVLWQQRRDQEQNIENRQPVYFVDLYVCRCQFERTWSTAAVNEAVARLGAGAWVP